MSLLTPDEQTWSEAFATHVLNPMQAIVRAARQQGIWSRLHQHGPLTVSLSLYPTVSMTSTAACASFLVQRTEDGWLISRTRHLPGQTQLDIPEEMHAQLPTSNWMVSELHSFVRQIQASGLLDSAESAEESSAVGHT